MCGFRASSLPDSHSYCSLLHTAVTFGFMHTKHLHHWPLPTRKISINTHRQGNHERVISVLRQNKRRYRTWFQGQQEKALVSKYCLDPWPKPSPSLWDKGETAQCCDHLRGSVLTLAEMLITVPNKTLSATVPFLPIKKCCSCIWAVFRPPSALLCMHWRRQMITQRTTLCLFWIW